MISKYSPKCILHLHLNHPSFSIFKNLNTFHVRLLQRLITNFPRVVFLPIWNGLSSEYQCIQSHKVFSKDCKTSFVDKYADFAGCDNLSCAECKSNWFSFLTFFSCEGMKEWCMLHNPSLLYNTLSFFLFFEGMMHAASSFILHFTLHFCSQKLFSSVSELNGL